jgi:hypothetical protein
MSVPSMQLAFMPGSSRTFTRILAGLHGGLAVLWCATTPPPLVLLSGLLLIVLGWRVAIRQSNGLARCGVVAVSETPGAQFPWRIEREDGSAEGAILDSRGIVCPVLIVATLVTPSRRYLCVLDADNVTADVHRRLRIRLLRARTRPATNA